MEKRITVGLVQQSNTPDREENMLRLKAGIEHCAEQGAQLVVLQELHNSLYFCQTENTECFDWAETVPGRRPTFTARSPVNRVSFSLHRFLNAGLRDCITIRPSSSTRTDPSPGNTAKCTFPTTLPTTKSSTLHRAIWDSSP